MNFSSIEGRDVLRRPLINSHSALSIPAYWRATNYVSENLASFSHEIRNDDGPVLDHPLNKLLKRRPNQFQTGYSFRRAVYFNAFHHGNGYALIRRVNPLVRSAANISGLYVLPSCDVKPFLVMDEGQEWFEGEKWYAYNGKVYPSEDIVHIHGLGYDGMMGWNPVALMSDTFERASLIGNYSIKALRKGGRIKQYVKIVGEVNDETVEALDDALRQYRNGGEREDEIPILPQAELVNLSASSAEMQLIQQEQFSTKQLAQITGVDPAYLFERSESKYNNSAPEQAGQDTVRFLFRTWIECAEPEWTTKLLAPEEQDAGAFININPDALLRGDTATQSSVVIAEVSGGVRNVNEGRELLGLPKDDAPESDELREPHAVASSKPTE